MPGWAYVVTGICTVLAGWGGVGLTLRGARSKWLDERRDMHRIEQRQAVVDGLRVGPNGGRSLGGRLHRKGSHPHGYGTSLCSPPY
jgi:hypothetical protein